MDPPLPSPSHDPAPASASASTSASASVAVQWVTIFHSTLYKFDSLAVHEVVRRFTLHKDVADATLTYDVDDDTFETRCPTANADAVSDALASVLAIFVSEKSAESDPGISEFEHAVVDFDALCDARSEAQGERRRHEDNPLIDFGQRSDRLVWHPKLESDVDIVAAPDLLEHIARLTGCAVTLDLAQRLVTVSPGVTGEPHRAIAKLQILEEHLSSKPAVVHSLKARKDLDFELQYCRLIDKSSSPFNYDGTLSRLLISHNSPALVNAPDANWPKIMASFYLVRAFKCASNQNRLHPIQRTPRPLKPKDGSQIRKAFARIKLRNIGHSPPTEAELPPQNDEEPPMEESMQHIQDWMQNVPTTEPGQAAPPPPELAASGNSSDSSSVPKPLRSPQNVNSFRPRPSKYEETRLEDAQWSAPGTSSNPWTDSARVNGPKPATGWSAPAPVSGDFPGLPDRSRVPANVALAQGTRNVGSHLNGTTTNQSPWSHVGDRGVTHFPSLGRGAAHFASLTRGGQMTQSAPRGQWGQPAQGPLADTGGQRAVFAPRGLSASARGNALQGAGRGARGAPVVSARLEDGQDGYDMRPPIIRTMRQQAPAPSSRMSVAETVTPSDVQSTSIRAAQETPAAVNKAKNFTVSRIELDKRSRVEAENIRAAVNSLQEALNTAQAFQGHLDFRLQIGQIYLQQIPKDARAGITYTRFVEMMNEMQGFDRISDNFTSMVTASTSDLDYVLEYAGIDSQNRPYYTSCHLELECQTSSLADVTMSVDVCADPPVPSHIVTGETMFGAWYTHHPLRVWDQRVLVTGKRRVELDDCDGVRQLLDSLYVRFTGDQPRTEVQGRDNEDARTTSVKLVQSTRYRVGTGVGEDACSGAYYLELKRVSDLRVLRPQHGAGQQRGLFLAQTLPEREMTKSQRFWYEITIGMVDSPEEFDQNSSPSMQLGDKATWNATEAVPSKTIEDMYEIGTKLVERMDMVGAMNKGLAADYETRKSQEFTDTMSTPDRFW